MHVCCYCILPGTNFFKLVLSVAFGLHVCCDVEMVFLHVFLLLAIEKMFTWACVGYQG